MIRSKHIASRLLLLVLFATFVMLAIDPLIHWSIERAGQAVTGARLSVATVRTSWDKSTIQLSDVQAVDPDHPSKHIFEAESINLELDRAALARRKVRVTRAQVRGLEVGTERRAATINERSNEGEYTAQLSERFVTDGGHWLETAGAELNRQLVGHSSTAAALLNVLERVPDDYEALEFKAAAITERILELDGILSDVGDNPLRNATSYQHAIAELESLRRDLLEVRREADQVHQQMLMDRETFAKAQAEDLRTMDERLEVASLDANNLSEYLMGPEISERVVTLSRWVRWGRSYLPSLHAQSTGLRHRGTDINLLDRRVEPDIFLETVILSGHAQVGSSRLQVEGSIAGLSSHPNAEQPPAEVVVQTTGDTQLLIQASFQGVGKAAVDKIVVNCPTMQLPERTLGDSSQLALKINPSVAHYWVELHIHDDNLSGEMVIKQQSVTLQPIMGAELQQTPIARLVSEAAGRIATIDSSVQLSGTIDNPEWSLRSNLGHELAQHLRSGLREQLVARNQSHIEQAKTEAAQELEHVARLLSSRHESIQKKIASSDGTINAIVEQIAIRVKQTDAIVDDRSPLRETIRR